MCVAYRAASWYIQPGKMAQLLESWRWIARTANVANLRATDSLNWRNFALGGTSTTLGAVVGLGIFATLQEGSHHPWVRIVAGGVTFLAAGLAALWKYLSYPTRAKEHQVASREYGNLVRLIDRELNSGTQITSAVAERIRKTMDRVDNASPNVSPFIWIWASEGVDAERKAIKAKRAPVDASTINRGALSRLARLQSRLLE
jgi:hypothetical protein